MQAPAGHWRAEVQCWMEPVSVTTLGPLFGPSYSPSVSRDSFTNTLSRLRLYEIQKSSRLILEETETVAITQQPRVFRTNAAVSFPCEGWGPVGHRNSVVSPFSSTKALL